MYAKGRAAQAIRLLLLCVVLLGMRARRHPTSLSSTSAVLGDTSALYRDLSRLL